MASFQAASWGKGVDETFQELTLEDICDNIAAVKKKRGPRKIVTSLWFNGIVVEIEVRRVEHSIKEIL